MANFRYIYDNTQKVQCPYCKDTKNTFVRYYDIIEEKHVSTEYGYCDRMNKCGFNTQIKNEVTNVKYEGHIDTKQKSIVAMEHLDMKYIDVYIHNTYSVHVFSKNLEKQYSRKDFNNIPYVKFNKKTSKFHYINYFRRGLMEYFGVEYHQRIGEVFEQMKLGTFYDGGVLFPYFDYWGKLLTGKVIFYSDTLKRVKNDEVNKRRNYPLWIHNSTYHPYGYKYETIFDVPGNYKPDLSLFNYKTHDDINSKQVGEMKIVGLVEAEKTAVIMSIIFPEIHWMATGGLMHLQPYRFMHLQHTLFFAFPDLGHIVRKGVKVHNFDLWKEKMDLVIEERINKSIYRIVNYVPLNSTPEDIEKWNEDGWDVADFILNNKEYIVEIKEIINKQLISI